MRNKCFSEFYDKRASLQTVKETYVEYVFVEVCCRKDIKSAIKETALILQIFENEVKKILLQLGHTF